VLAGSLVAGSMRTNRMNSMSNSSTVQRLALPSGRRSPARLDVRAIRCECQHCYTPTFLVLRTLGEAKCSVCESYDLVPVED
jgi:hypothetical protein